MRTSAIFEKLKTGEMSLDFAGHCIGYDLQDLLHIYDHTVYMANGGGDGTWDGGMTDGRMRAYYQRKLDFQIKDGEATLLLYSHFKCHNCSDAVRWVLSGNTLRLAEHIVKDAAASFGIRFDVYPAYYTCPYAHFQSFKGAIQVQSPLIFANIFQQFADAPKGEQYSDAWSIDTLKGRESITGYRVAQNIAYGQMGNMSVGIYLHEDRKSVIVGPASHPAEYAKFDSDEEYRSAISIPAFAGYEKVGELILEVWRWEATTLNTLKATGTDMDAFRAENEFTGVVELDVPCGTWNFEHYYGIRADDDDLIYAKLTLNPGDGTSQ